MAEERKAQLQFGVDGSAVKPGLDAIKRDVKDASADIARSGQDASKGLEAIGSGAQKAAGSVDRETRSIIGSIQRTTAAHQAGEKGTASYYEALAKQRGISGDILAPYLTQLRAVEEAQKAAMRSQENLGVSAKQTAAALRGVPAQLTDIVVSLQGGQAPLTVLLQQGGQLKDMFGGIVPAAKALGGAVVGLVNPFTLTAAAAGALGFAMIKAESSLRDSNALMAQIQGTGRASEISSAQLKSLSRELQELPGVTKEFANATIGEFVRTRQIGGDMFQQLALSVADFAAATGQQVPDAAKALTKAFADPAQRAKALDEQLGILSASQQIAIQNMLEMGDKAGAQKALFDALQGSIKGLADNALTPLGRETKAFGDQWDRTMQNVGNASALRSANELVAGLVGHFTRLVDVMARAKPPAWLEAQFKGGLNGAVFGAIAGGATTSAPAQAAAAAPQMTAAQIDSRMLDEQVKSILGVTSAYKSAAGAADGLKGKAAQLRGAMQSLEAAGQKGGAAYKELADRLGGVNEKIADAAKKGGAAARQEQSAYETLIASINAKIAANAEELRFSGRVTEADKLRVKMLAELDAGSRKLTESHKANALGLLATLDAQERQKAATAASIKVFQEQVALSEEAAQAYVQESKAREQGAMAVSTYLKGITDTAEALQVEIDGIGKTAAERQKLIDKYNVELKLRQQIAAINANPGFTQDQRDAQIGRASTGAASDLINKDLAAAAKSLNDYLDPERAQDFGAALGEALEGAFSPLQKLGDSFAKLIKTQERSTKEFRNLEKLLDSGKIGLPEYDVKRYALEQKSVQDSLKDSLSLYGDIAGAASSYFDEGTRGYRAMQAVSQAFHAAEMAYAVSSLLITQQTEAAKQSTFGITALANALTAPWPANIAAFASVAAMLASIGISAGGGGGGGGGGYTGIAKGGTGTVLGMEGEQSESISNAIELLSDNSKIELAYTQKMLSELTKVREGIQGLAGTASTDFFIRGFAGASFGDDFLDSGIGFFPGQKVADIIEKGVQGVGFNLIFSNGAQAMWKALDEEFTTGVGRVLANVAETVFTAADALGLNDAALAERMLSLIPTLGDTSTYAMNGITQQGGGLVSLKDMSGEEIQKELEAIFSAVGDQMAAAALPALRPFQQIGEGMFETLIRVTTGIETAQYALEQFGLKAIDYADIVRKNGDIAVEIMRQTIMGVEQELATYRYGSAGMVVSGATPQTGLSEIIETFVGDASELQELYAGLLDVRGAMKSVGAQALDLSRDMIRGAGGLEALQSGLDSYLTEFFSEQEQVDSAWARMAEQFDRLGVAMPDTNEQFRKMVEGLDTSTTAGANLFGGMMSLAEAFADVTGRSEDLAEAARAAAEEQAEAARQAAEEAAQAMADSWKSLWSAVDGVAADFLSGDQLQRYRADSLSVKFADIGLTVTPEQILGAGKAEFEALFHSIDKTTTAGREQAAAMVGLWNSFKQLLPVIEAVATAVDDTWAKLRSAADSVVADFLSGDELRSYRAESLAEKFQGIGIGVDPGILLRASQQDFLDLFHSIDKTTAAGREQSAGLLGLWAAFKQLLPATQETTQALIDQAGAAYQALEQSTAAEKARLQAAYDAQVEAINKATEAAQEAARGRLDAISGIFSALDSAIDSTRVSSAALDMDARRAAQGRLQGAADYSRTGRSLTGYADLTGALDILSQPSEDLFTSFEDYARDQAATSVLMVELRDRAKAQVSVAEMTLKAIEDSGAAQLKALQEQYDADVAALDAQLEYWRAQLDAVRGVNNNVLSVRDAITAMSKAITDALAALEPVDGVDGSHASGLAYVPFDGYRAELHRGETVLNAEQAKLYRGGALGGSNSSGDQLTRELLQEVAAMRRELGTNTADTARASKESAQVLRGADTGDGLVFYTAKEAAAL